jgi:hypothetical protein
MRTVQAVQFSLRENRERRRRRRTRKGQAKRSVTVALESFEAPPLQN